MVGPTKSLLAVKNWFTNNKLKKHLDQYLSDGGSSDIESSNNDIVESSIHMNKVHSTKSEGYSHASELKSPKGQLVNIGGLPGPPGSQILDIYGTIFFCETYV